MYMEWGAQGYVFGSGDGAELLFWASLDNILSKFAKGYFYNAISALLS